MRKPDSFKINAKVAAMILLIIALGLTQNSASQAQTRGGPVTVASVSSHPSANGTAVSIAADGPLNRAQTWQDREGYHVVVPSAGAQNAIKVGKGIKVRQLDHSLEIVIQTKPGANVTVQPTGNHLNLNVEGKLDSRAAAAEADNARASSKSELSQQSGSAEGIGNSKAARASKAAAEQEARAARAGSAADARQSSAAESGSVAVPPNAQGAPQGQEPEAASGEFSVMSGTTVLVVVGLGCLGLLLLRRRRATHLAEAVRDGDGDDAAFDDLDFADETIEETNRSGKTKGFQDNLAKQNASGGPNGISPQRKSPARMQLAMPASLFGAYQVDQEIGKLVLGQPHKMDVLASRAPDDRRAIEASLLKTLISADADEDLRRRARGALEEYGFVARQSAALLLAEDPYERTSAARMLGDSKSPAALPFLLEALYDRESLVRNQAVLSIGELRLPSAIGALLDIARKHPDVPGALLTRALSACSVEGLDFFDSPIPQPRSLSGIDAHVLAQEIIKLEPASVVQGLAESADDEKLIQALVQIESQDINERSEAVKVLGQFSVRTSVAALSKVARLDPATSLRALAISSLAFINHESVFPAILIAMADESRGVRAAAARSLSRLSFDRADAYIRVTETDDAETLRDVAQACIKAGIAAQGLDRLASTDHQAYEALSVVSLLVKANTVEPLLEAIATHPNMDVRLTVIYVLGMVGQPGVLEQLRPLAADCTSEVLQNALLETIAKLELPQDAESDALGSEFELGAQPELEPQAQFDSEVAAASDFELETNGEFEAPSESEVEAQLEREQEPHEVESSGLPAPTIA